MQKKDPDNMPGSNVIFFLVSTRIPDQMGYLPAGYIFFPKGLTGMVGMDLTGNDGKNCSLCNQDTPCKQEYQVFPAKKFGAHPLLPREKGNPIRPNHDLLIVKQ
ncbi:MAG: hypothetical protein ACO25B_02470 [Chitinophagaceae bacterium]